MRIDNPLFQPGDLNTVASASFATTASYALNSAGGGGGGVSGYATIKATAQSPANSTDITWQTLNTTGSGITLPSGSNTAFIRIPSGSWRITTSLYGSGFSNTTGGLAQLQFVNVSNTVLPEFAALFLIPATYTGNDVQQSVIDGILTVTAPTTTIKVRCTGATGTCNIAGSSFSTGMIIQRLS